MLSLTLKREFLAIHTQKKSAESFYKTCYAIPDGVAIINDESSQCSFLNPNLKNIFKLEKFCEQDKNLECLMKIQEKMDSDFD